MQRESASSGNVICNGYDKVSMKFAKVGELCSENVSLLRLIFWMHGHVPFWVSIWSTDE